MPVNTRHPEYVRMVTMWQRAEDAYDGEDKVHNERAKYLPKLKEQEDAEYKAYVMRTPFYNATYRTISGLVGMLFRKPPIMEVPPAMVEMMDDVSLDGTPMHLFAQSVATEVLRSGRAGVLVDYPTVSEDQAVTQADAAALNLQPILSMYISTSIINWTTGRVNNRHVLTMVVLEEEKMEKKDEFKSEGKKQWRVLDLFEGVYRQRLYTRDEGDKDVQVGGDIYPEMNSKKLDYIPFVFIGADDITPAVDKPPLIDLVNVNMSHYRTSADLEHGAHFTGLPTPIITGYRPDGEGEKLYIGSTTAWPIPAPDAKAYYLEFTGEGLGALEKLIDRKEMEMAVLGARMLEPQKLAAETAETTTIHRKGEESLLASIAQVISLGLGVALSWFADWAVGSSDKVSYSINRDFFPVPMSSQQLSALMSAWQQGGISKQVLFENLQRGEIISEDADFEEEEQRISDQGPDIDALIKEEVERRRQEDAAAAGAGDE